MGHQPQHLPVEDPGQVLAEVPGGAVVGVLQSVSQGHRSGQGVLQSQARRGEAKGPGPLLPATEVLGSTHLGL